MGLSSQLLHNTFFNFLVPMNMDVETKALLMGANFMVVSTTLL